MTKDSKSTVVKVEFGKELREYQRKLALLMGRLADAEEAFEKHPMPVLHRLLDDLGVVINQLRDARQALVPRFNGSFPEEEDCLRPTYMRTMTVYKDEWERLQRCAEIIREARR